jgi:preprotein translocase subunit Sec63
MRAAGFLERQLENLGRKKRREALGVGFFVKVGVVVVAAVLTAVVYEKSRATENKMKGFDPFEILGLSAGATLREVKKAYR